MRQGPTSLSRGLASTARERSVSSRVASSSALRFATWGDLVEARLTIGGTPLLLVAGELELLPSGEVVPAWGDESVLGFTKPENADRLPWRPSRESWR